MQPLFALCPALKAQSLILQGGLNGSRWGGETMDFLEQFEFANVSQKVKLGYQIEALIDIPLTEQITISPGIRLNRIGFTMEISSLPGQMEGGLSTDFSASFIEVPLCVRYYHTVNNDLKVYGSAGGYFGGLLMTSVEAQETFDGDSESFSDSQMADDFVPSFGLEIGCGLDYKKWLAGLSFKYGSFGEDGVAFLPAVVSLNLGYRLF